ncbi:hypothetical protein ACFWMQ_21220 [Streptomyces sp. NPDC058372]|uniref:hypothetical protein n=1 Tax=Streptomyces sp. NPDC058372 TaxID=3346464 RepID=UPI003647CFC2
MVLALVAGAGWLAKPVWQPWWYAATLCWGNLSGRELAELLPTERLQASKDTFGSGNGPLRCGVDAPQPGAPANPRTSSPPATPGITPAQHSR